MLGDANLFLLHLGCSLLGLMSLKHSHSFFHLKTHKTKHGYISSTGEYTNIKT
jgi:hypothetical protein